MSVSTFISGIVPADDKFEAMRKIWDSCDAAGITPPDEVCKFFGGVKPDPKGIVENFGSLDFPGTDKHTFISSPKNETVDIDLTRLPKKFKSIRIENSC